MEITLTPKAEKFIGRMIRFNGGTPAHGFRLVVSPGGCSGLSSEFTVEAAPFEGDQIIEANGLRLFLPAESRILLD
ncbi:MAG TPA: iron-sulfur cluster assembly accessory protein, partial [Methylophilaceae bacterium]|nr:iron-sulfur cluster assembly accessory protein [Methylophilaceae bacterium]